MPTFPTPRPVSVTLELPVAQIRLRASDREDTVVAVRPGDPGKSADVQAAERARIEYTDGRLEIRAPRSLRRFSPFHGGGAVDVAIDLPAGSHVRGEGSIIHVQAEGSLGTCHITTSVGDLSLERATAVTLATSGRISVGGTGAADIDEADAVHIGELAGSATIKTRSGTNGDMASIRIDDLVRGDVTLEAGYGRIDIGVRTGTAARLDASTEYGQVRNGLETAHTMEPSEETATVRAHTSYGDIVVRRSDPAQRPA